MKSIAPTTPYGYTIFCDDVRLEASGKSIYIGIYRDSLILNTQLPSVLPKFCLVIHYFERPNESKEPVTVHVYLPDDQVGSPTHTAELPIQDARQNPLEPETPDADPIIGVISHLMFSPLALKSEGRIRVRAYRGDFEIRLGTLGVVERLGKNPN